MKIFYFAFLLFLSLFSSMILLCATFACATFACDNLQYVNKDFGTCPLVQCGNQAVLPVGLRDDMGTDTVKIFCPKCQCVYHPPPIRSRSHHSTDDIGSANVDGASFGTTFPHLFLMTFSNLVPERLSAESAYIPRVFGFRVHKTSKSRNDGSTSNSSSVSAARSSRRSNANANASVAAAAAATTGTTESAAANGQKTEDVDAADAANDDSARTPLGQDGQEDISAASPAITTNDNSGNQSKSNKGTSSKIKKGARNKSEDSGGSTKRKAKNNNSSNGNGDGDGKSKRPKRPSNKT